MTIITRKDLESNLEFRCAALAIEIGRAVRVKINNMSLSERATPATSILKPDAKDRAKFADAEGERIGIEYLEGFSSRIKHDIHLVVEPGKGTLHKIGKNKSNQVIFAYLDAVDGTIKVAGLGNDAAHNRYRVANDGAWGTGMAFTSPTEKTIDELTIGDFRISAITDGNPPMYKTFPREVIAFPYSGRLTTFEFVNDSIEQVFTTINDNLSQSMVYLDSFQAFDKLTRKTDDDMLAKEIYGKLIDRNQGGAFDVLRQYGNLSALIRNMLGWRSPEVDYEAQCSAFLTINENLPNMIPAVPIILGAEGVAVDFEGLELKDRRLVDGRSNILYAANNGIAMKIVRLIHKDGRI